MKPALAFLLALSLLLSGGCTLCRHGALHDADQWAAQGYPSRIATYYLNLDGLIYGAGIWKSHAQAQVQVGGQWKWVGEFGGLRETPTFTMRQVESGIDYWYWSPDEYRGLLASQKDVR